MQYILMALLLITTLFAPPTVQAGLRLTHETSLQVEPGDSFIGLFGTDWQRVLDANRDVAFRDQQGRLLPDRLVSGVRLVVPAGTYITDDALARINRCAETKAAALAALAAAQEQAQKSAGLDSDPAQQGRELLAKARALAAAENPGFANYLAAHDLAIEAARFLRLAQDIRDSKLSLATSSRQMAEAIAAVNNIRRNGFLFMTFIITALTVGAMYLRKRTRIKNWLARHEARLARLMALNL